jgi:hypothetical protein
MPSNTDTLLPCPFCGNRAFSYAMDGGYVAECEGCACRTSICDSRGVEVETWNTRPTTDAGLMPTEEMIEAGRGVLNDYFGDDGYCLSDKDVGKIYTAMHEARTTTDVSTEGLAPQVQRYFEQFAKEQAAALEALQRSNAEKDERILELEAAVVDAGYRLKALSAALREQSK